MDKNNTTKTSLNWRECMICICAGILLATIVYFTIASITNSLSNRLCDSKLSDPTRPYSPYLMQRDTMDGGFSRGWMPHFPPSEEYWVDMHVHLRDVTGSDDLKQLLDGWFSRLDAYRLGRIVVITNQENLFDVFAEFSQKDPRFAWMFWPNINEPSLSQVHEAVRCGACALKLHNSPIMSGRTPRHIYQNDEWQAIFAYAASAGIPLLWHVTQRHSYSPYHGGGYIPYWQQGWEKGVDFTNEDLLQDVLTQMRRYPKLKVIHAHQSYVGVDRMTELFKEYENLYVDSSVGMYLRWADDFIEKDRLLLRDFVETWSERIVFGTDSGLSPNNNIDEYAVQGYLCHSRFFMKLRLSDKALQDVAWRTSQRVFNLNMTTLSSSRRGSVRP